MKKLQDFADEINKCSKCGLCQSVCPVYKITGNDCAVSRGKFVMLDGVLKGDLKLSKNIEKYLDMCLKCGKCKNFCPSSIDVCEIFNTAKYEYAKNTFHGKLEKFLESDLIFGNFIKLVKSLTNFGLRQKLNSISASNNNTPKTKLLYFKGCVNNIAPKVENDLKKVFSNMDVEVIEKDFECCGLPFLSSGNLERFEQVKNRNLQLLDCEFDYILTDCASCESTLKGYFKNTEYKPGFINAGEFAATQNVRFSFKKNLKVTFHKPCHLENANFIKTLLEKCENVEYIEMKDFDECCGFAGEFALKNPKLSAEISQRKAKNILQTGADIVLTTCPACVLGILQGFAAAGVLHKKHPKVMNVMEFLANAEGIETYQYILKDSSALRASE